MTAETSLCVAFASIVATIFDKAAVGLSLGNSKTKKLTLTTRFDKSGKLSFYSDEQIESAKPYRSEHRQKNDKKNGKKA